MSFQDTFEMYDYYATLEAETLNNFLDFSGSDYEISLSEYESAKHSRKTYERLLESFC